MPFDRVDADGSRRSYASNRAALTDTSAIPFASVNHHITQYKRAASSVRSNVRFVKLLSYFEESEMVMEAVCSMDADVAFKLLR